MTLTRERERIRAVASGVFDATGKSELTDVYKVPFGYEFEVRRVFLDGGAYNEANLINATSLIFVDGFLRYYRSGTPIEWGITQCAVINGACFPGNQTWAEEEGPRLMGGEVFQVQMRGGVFIDNTPYTVSIEGELTKIDSPR